MPNKLLNRMGDKYILIWTGTIKGKSPLQIIGVFDSIKEYETFMVEHFSPSEIFNDISVFRAPYYQK